MDWSKLLTFLKEESPYFSMAVAVVLAAILLLPLFAPNGAPIISDLLEVRSNFLPWIFALFFITAVIGIYGRITRSVKIRKERQEEARKRQEKESLLAQLQKLEIAGKKFKDQDDCVQWASKVAPLLRYNVRIYQTFQHFSSFIPLGLSSVTTMPAVNSMRAQVKEAIEELKDDLKN